MDAQGELEREINRITPGSHLCLVYESTEEQLAAVVPYVKSGLARGERCVYIADDRAVEEIELALAQAGVDLARERRRGALIILTKRDAYLRSGAFDPEAMIALLREMIERSLEDGFAGLCITGEMTWALGPEAGNERLIEYESLLNGFLPGTRARAVCQYNRRLFPPAITRDVLRTHPVAVVGGLVCPNVFYEPPDMLLGRRSIAEEVTWRIEQLKAARATARALERAEEAQRLLGDATSILVSSLDHRKTLRELSRFLVPRLADSCAFKLLDDDGASDEIVAFARSDTGRRSELIAPMVVRGETIGTMTLATAESGRVFVEEDRELADELARRTATAVDNAHLFRRANEAIAARDDFLTVAAHELQTPLTTLELQIQMLERQAPALAKDADALASLETQLVRLHRQSGRLRRLAADLLDISRIVAGRLALAPERVDLSQVVDGVLCGFEEAATAARCELRRELEPDLVGRWDRTRLEQVVSNLLSNAIKYGAGRPVRVSTSGSDGAVKLVVADEGIGIAPEDHARIFGRFERAVPMRYYGGLGLGLFVVKQAVDAMGGGIELVSALGRGATFTVTLPRNDPSADSA